MAEEQQQSKGIGELFVEFGAKGLPTLLKGLNTVSASFLLTKNAAEQFTKPIINAGKQAANSAVGVAKLSSSLGTTLLEAQKLQLYFQKHNLSESLLGDLGSTADMLTKVRMGIGGISGEFAYAMHRMGLSWIDYDGSIESMEKLMRDVDNATKTMDPRERRIMLQSIGWSPEMGYAFDRGLNLSDARAISDEEVKKWIELSEAANETRQAVDQTIKILGAKVTPIVTKAANGIITRADNFNNNEHPTIDKVIQNHTEIKPKNTRQMSEAWTTPGYQQIKDLWNRQTIKGQPTGFAVPPVFQGTAHIPPNLNSSNTTIQVTNENHVSVATPQDVGPAISSISRDTLRDIEYSEFQTINRPGL